MNHFIACERHSVCWNSTASSLAVIELDGSFFLLRIMMMMEYNGMGHKLNPLVLAEASIESSSAHF